MKSSLLHRRDLEFVLYELLQVQTLTCYPRYAEHSRTTFDAAIDTAAQLAERYFAPHNRKADLNEPRLVDGRVELIPEVKPALQHFAAAGFLAAHHDYDAGGMQLPWVVTQACFAYFQAANIATAAYPFLTIAAANLLKTFASGQQQQRFMLPMLRGRFFATMALSEPHAGSSLADVRTRATLLDDGSYALRGQKMWTSAGAHELSENIIHLVLARIDTAPAGVKGLSLFIVPRYRLNDDGSKGPCNDVRLIGLNHKMGYRGTVNTVLNFGENEACQGFLIGQPNQGLAIMFHMMNEARIGVGMGATMLGYAGYLASLDYARNRPQGRLPDNKNPQQPPVMLIEHADVKRMLLAQKAWIEGGLALGLYGAQLVDRRHNAHSDDERHHSWLLLELLTPVIKAWGSKYALKANDYAIQILGGYGYTRDYLLEQYYRDNRLNPIHEGTNGIQAIDLLGRKIFLQDGAAFALLQREIRASIAASKETLASEFRQELRAAADRLDSLVVTLRRARETLCAHIWLANASLFMDMLGRIVMAWIWLQQATIARSRLMSRTSLMPEDIAFYRGKLKACQYFFRYELVQTRTQHDLLISPDSTCLDMEDDWF
jgi:butyryl-CoA dehydrogenase